MPTYFIGTDEAGYGPSLGPLVVTATAWRVDGAAAELDFYQRLAHLVTRPASRSRSMDNLSAADSRLEIGDSKQLYSAGSDPSRLELGVWAMFGSRAPCPTSWETAWEALAPGSRAALQRHPWNHVLSSAFPWSIGAARLAEWTRRSAQCLEAAGVALVGMRSRAVFPDEWNELLDRHEGKAEVLSLVTLDLVRRVIDGLPPGAILVQCDKHGGRNRYGALLQTVFPDDWFEVVRESRELSHYRLGSGEDRREFRFRAGGEDQLPVALASMASKYLREVAMRSFNQFWCSHVPDLRPTAGYPVDARRFHDAIAVVQRQLDVPDRVLWRRK